MTKYISILRGINVGGQKPIKMEALRMTYESLGYGHVTTYIQSGNVIFTGEDLDRNEMAEIISRQIKKDFGFEVPVIVLSLDKLKKVINENPFLCDLKKDHSFLYITLLASNPGSFDKKTIEQRKQKGEEIAFMDDVIYLWCPNGYGKTKLNNNFLEMKLKVTATTRNWKTMNELFQIAKQITK